MVFKFFKRKSSSSNPAIPPKTFYGGPVLEILDNCARAFTFPVLDNGYYYLAAARLTAFHGNGDWALVIETFGFSPKAGHPSLTIQTYGSKLINRPNAKNYVTQEAFDNYLSNNPQNEYKTFGPIENDDWMDEEFCEHIKDVGKLRLRGLEIPLPPKADYAAASIVLEEDRPLTFELCRFLAENYRDTILGTDAEKRFNVPDSLLPILTLDDWHHPNLAIEELPSQLESFQQLQEVLLTGDPNHYTQPREGNTHWSNWPEGGIL